MADMSAGNLHLVQKALKKRDINILQLAELISERPEKISLAIRCKSGVGKRAVAIRQAVADELKLNAIKVWGELAMTPGRIPKGSRGEGRPLSRPLSSYTKEEWASISANERIRSLLHTRNMTVMEFSQHLGLDARGLSNAASRGLPPPELAERISKELGCKPENIWDFHVDGYDKPIVTIPLQHPNYRAFYTFGNMHEPIHSPYGELCENGSIDPFASAAKKPQLNNHIMKLRHADYDLDKVRSWKENTKKRASARAARERNEQA